MKCLTTLSTNFKFPENSFVRFVLCTRWYEKGIVTALPPSKHIIDIYIYASANHIFGEKPRHTINVYVVWNVLRKKNMEFIENEKEIILFHHHTFKTTIQLNFSPLECLPEYISLQNKIWVSDRLEC